MILARRKQSNHCTQDPLDEGETAAVHREGTAASPCPIWLISDDLHLCEQKNLNLNVAKAAKAKVLIFKAKTP